ncbi:MAG: hypothetical protein ACI8XO_000411 [Verrucomicrobiales bacterium]|jgi:hypothetical protein
MNPKAIAISARPLLVASFVLALISGVAQAQLMVDMKLSKKNYVEHEPVMATIQVRNLAGHDMILSGPGGAGWLNLDILRGTEMVHPRPNAPKLKSRALKAGASFTTEVNLGRFYPLAMPGNYGVTASVYYPPLKRYIPSQRTVVNVRRAKVLWSREFGVPQGNNRPIRFRKFSLLSYRDRDSSSVYVRLSERDDSSVLATYSLGRALVSYQPGVFVDASNRLNVLHLGGPQFYAHSIVDSDGDLVRQDYYKQVSGSTPRLINQSGSIVVRGGVKTDRNGIAATQFSSPMNERNPGRVRNGTERPPGLPPR